MEMLCAIPRLGRANLGPHGPISGKGFVLIPRLDVEASAGSGALIGREQVLDYLAFRESRVRRDLEAELVAVFR